MEDSFAMDQAYEIPEIQCVQYKILKSYLTMFLENSNKMSFIEVGFFFQEPWTHGAKYLPATIRTK